MRRIVQVSPHYPPLLGGLERVVEILAARLAADPGNDVGVLTTNAGASGAPRRATENGVTVRRLRAISAAHTAVAPGLPLALLRVPRDAVVHLHSSQILFPELVWLGCRLRGVRYIVHFHMHVDASGRLGELVLPAYHRHVFGRVLRAAAGVITLTESQARFVEETYRVAPERISVVPNGVAPEFFHAPRPAGDGPLKLLYVGRLGAQKNVGRLLEALSLCTEPVRLRIVGDGELRADLEARATELGLTGEQVRFLGRKDGAELVEEYVNADAFALPSDREGMALVAVEAMAAGLPVVATAVPGNTELLDGIGLLVEPDAQALAKGVDALAADAGLRGELAARSASAATRYTWEAAVAAVESAYDKAGVGR
ncbi:MAG TPA: glycosyltransferase family 4 protein [Actinospica sp.]|nr:glycosyltransferase family 4 protein [Actinospica sp.]